MAEFALTIPLIALLLLGGLSAGLYALQRSAAVAAAAEGASIAASASPADLNHPDLGAGELAAATRLRPLLLGSRIVILPEGASCPPAGKVAAGRVFVCARLTGPTMVRLAVSGRPRQLAAGPFAMPVEEAVELHLTTFQR